MLPLPSYDSQFIILFESGEGYVRRHVLVDINASDYSHLKIFAYEKAIAGMNVDIMPILIESHPLRSIIFFDAIKNKNPDLRIDGVLWEVERSYNSENINNLKHAIDEGSRQADHVIIDLSHEISQSFMFKVAKGRFKDHSNLKVIEFRYNGIYTSFSK